MPWGHTTDGRAVAGGGDAFKFGDGGGDLLDDPPLEREVAFGRTIDGRPVTVRPSRLLRADARPVAASVAPRAPSRAGSAAADAIAASARARREAAALHAAARALEERATSATSEIEARLVEARLVASHVSPSHITHHTRRAPL